jgi:hypothetical protein
VLGGEDLVGDEQGEGWPGGDEPGHGGGVGGGDVPARGSLSAAIEGRRLARLTLDSQPQLRPEPAEQLDQADNDQAEDPPADPPARTRPKATARRPAPAVRRHVGPYVGETEIVQVLLS